MHAYLQLVLERFDCYGTWLPGSAIAVGEIGKQIGRGSFSRTGDLEERTQEPLPPTRQFGEPPRQETTGTSVKPAAGGAIGVSEILQVLGDASTEVSLKMDRRNSAALILEKATRRQFSDERVIRALMQSMLLNQLIDIDEVLVTYVLKVDSGVVAASSSHDVSVEADVGVDLGISELKLGKVGGRLAIMSGETSESIAVAEEDNPLTPMYRVLFFRGSRRWFSFWKKQYTVEALIQGAASLRAYRGGSQFHSAHRLLRRGYAEAAGLVDPLAGFGLASDWGDVVSSSLPSVSLAEQALQELGDIGLSTEAIEPIVGVAPTVGVRVPEEPLMVDVYNNLGGVLQAQGDLEGAQRHFEQALEWAEAMAVGRLPHETERQEPIEVKEEPTGDETAQ